MITDAEKRMRIALREEPAVRNFLELLSEVLASEGRTRPSNETDASWMLGRQSVLMFFYDLLRKEGETIDL
jgi:hypothetical protein